MAGFVRKAVFLDRDGVINKKLSKDGGPDYVKRWEEFKFLPGAFEALVALTHFGYEIYVITNQRGISRGLMTEDDLKDIHEKMKEELAAAGAKITDIYYCPHGYEDNCDCRKPKPGMLLRAAKEHSLDLRKVLFIGDDEKDIEAGKAAGCSTILVNEENNLLSVVKSRLWK